MHSHSKIYVVYKPDFDQAKDKLKISLSEICQQFLDKPGTHKYITQFLRDLEGSSSWEELIEAMRITQGEVFFPLKSVGNGTYILRESFYAAEAYDFDAPGVLLLWALPDAECLFSVYNKHRGKA